jgi:hypothetical protein
MRRLGYQNAALTAIAVLLGLNLVNGNGVTAPSSASAQPENESVGGLISASEQRKVMIAELKSISSRLERIDSKLAAGGVAVKVTDMPALKLPPELLKRLVERAQGDQPQPAEARDQTK